MCPKGIMAVLSIVIAACLGAEDNRRTNELDGDSSYRLLQFERVFLPHWSNEDIPVTGQNRFINWPWESVPQHVADNALLRDRRQFYRFGKDLQQSQDKRFLRFGRAGQLDDEDYNRALFSQEEPLYRKRRSTQIGNQPAESLHRARRSADVNTNNNNIKANNDILHLETNTGNTKNNDRLKTDQQSDQEGNMDKRFMRFGKRFMRFGRGDQDNESNEKRFFRFGKRFDDNQDLDKRFMRFGKRFISFGRNNEEDEDTEKRFMRFGKSGDYNTDAEKRFMRFGKRFMRFGKRFMRFGRGDEDDNDQLIN